MPCGVSPVSYTHLDVYKRQVCHEGKANPNQLVMNEANFEEFVQLRQLILDKHREKFGTTDDLVIGLQLTHSGRFCKPNSLSLIHI